MASISLYININDFMNSGALKILLPIFGMENRISF